jgi:hypothetical protein
VIKTVRVDENCDFQQIALPLDLAIGEHILQRIRLEADSELSAWYELYLVVTQSGFLIEKHSGSSRSNSRLKETWFRRTLPEAKRKYSQILSLKLNHKRRSPRKYKVVNDENQEQQKLFG